MLYLGSSAVSLKKSQIGVQWMELCLSSLGSSLLSLSLNLVFVCQSSGFLEIKQCYIAIFQEEFLCLILCLYVVSPIRPLGCTWSGVRHNWWPNPVGEKRGLPTGRSTGQRESRSERRPRREAAGNFLFQAKGREKPEARIRRSLARRKLERLGAGKPWIRDLTEEETEGSEAQ